MSHKKTGSKTNTASVKTSSFNENANSGTTAKVNGATSHHTKAAPTFTSKLPDDRERRDGPGGD